MTASSEPAIVGFPSRRAVVRGWLWILVWAVGLGAGILLVRATGRARAAPLPVLWQMPEWRLVDQGGRRILDEGRGGISISNDLARLNDPLCGTVICDAAMWETAGRAAQIPPNPQLLAGGGTLHQSDTLEALAEAASLPPTALADTVAIYNSAVSDNTIAALSPPRSTRGG